MTDQSETLQESVNDALAGFETDYYVYVKDDSYVIVRGYSEQDQYRYDYLDEDILDRLMQAKYPGCVFVEVVRCSDIADLFLVTSSNVTIFQYVGPGDDDEDFTPLHLEPLDDYYVFTEEPSNDVPGKRNFVVVTMKRRTFPGQKFFSELGKLTSSDHRIEFYCSCRDQNASAVHELLETEVRWGDLLQTGGRFFNWDGETLIERGSMNGGNA